MMVEKLAPTNVKAVSSNCYPRYYQKSVRRLLCGILSIYGRIVTIEWIEKKVMQMETYYKAINWNAIEDVIDKSTWEN